MKQQEKMILIKEIYKGLGVNTSVESMEIKAFDIYAEQQIKELKERLHNAEKILIAINSLHNGSERISELVHEHFISTDKQVLKK